MNELNLPSLYDLMLENENYALDREVADAKHLLERIGHNRGDSQIVRQLAAAVNEITRRTAAIDMVRTMRSKG